jgi:hypothetical protein
MKGYRSILVAFLPIFFGILAQTDWDVFLKDPKAGGVGIICGIAMMMCRFVTDTPIFKSKHPAEVEVEEVKKQA